MDAWTGRLVDERGEPHRGLVVALEDVLAEPRIRLAQTTTGEDGGFRLPAPPDVEWDAPAGLALGAYDPLGLRPLERALLAGDQVGHLPDLVVPRRRADGWIVTDRAGAPLALTDGSEVEVYAHAEMFDAIHEAISKARRSIDLSQLIFERGFSGSRAMGRRPTLLGEILGAAERGVRVRLLLNANAVLADSFPEVCDAVRDAPAGAVEVRRFALTPNVLHAKILVVDEEVAFIVGPPFQQKYWDTSRHRPDEARRGKGKAPLHDLSVRVRGPALRHVHAMFVELWNARDPGYATPRALHAPTQPRMGPTTTQFVRTLPPDLLPGAPDGATGILEAYLRAIAQARDYLYLETQYFTSPTIAEALARALRRRPSLEVILVLNENTDVPGYIRWQKHRLLEMGYPHLPGLGVFHLRSPAPVYVHAKVALADDAWATVGTANLDSMSLQTGDEFAAPIDPNVDCNLVLLDGIEGAPATGEVARLRRRLWAEHLGDEGVWSAPTRPAEGWLPLWRRVAEDNLRRLRDGKRMRGNALPYLPDDLRKAAAATAEREG